MQDFTSSFVITSDEKESQRNGENDLVIVRVHKEGV